MTYAEETAAATAADAQPAEEAAQAEGGDAAATDEAKGQQFMDSAKELQEKLAQLKALLDAKGDNADPGLKEKLSGLESQLSSLGLDGLSGGSAGAANDPELTRLLVACSDMAMRRVGIQRPSTLGSLRRLVDNKLPPADAAKDELWRMVAVCVNELTEADFSAFKAGKLRLLPKTHVEASQKPEAEKQVLELQPHVWDELRQVAQVRLDELVGGDGKQLPMGAAYLAFIPIGGMVLFMLKLYKDSQRAQEEKDSAKRKKRSGSKSD